ncbi:hypothetical protein I312_105706 [Cryptococcus bacillisporus CA1280]|uniref:uncharacterized protein n=1 Tax=Cryptococcus bacillisporus CA1280 TaxID=1296109 RepID=UPI0033665C6E
MFRFLSPNDPRGGNGAEVRQNTPRDLENLLTELAGPHWRIDHDVVSPHAPITNSVTASTPLPKPKPIHPSRHSPHWA